MKNSANHLILLIVLLLSMAIFNNANAQHFIDTISIGKRKPFFTYQNQEFNNPKKLSSILLRESVDVQINDYWNQYKTIHNVALGTEVAGVGIMAIGLSKKLNGKESGGTMIGGASLMLTGVIIDAFVAKRKALAAVERYNDLKMQRHAFDLSPRPEDLLLAPDSTFQPTPVVRNKTSSSTSSGRYIGIAIGMGRSRQKINYAFEFDETFKYTPVSSFGIQYGESISEKMSWQIELGLTQHGYRLEDNGNYSGVKTTVHADTRIRYLEVPFSLIYNLPIGDRDFELSAMPGINIGYLMSGKLVAHSKGKNETREVDIKIVDQLSMEGIETRDRLDVALLLGAQATYPLGTGKVFMEARYHFGILNLERNVELSITEEGDKAFNRSILFRIGYRHVI